MLGCAAVVSRDGAMANKHHIVELARKYGDSRLRNINAAHVDTVVANGIYEPNLGQRFRRLRYGVYQQHCDPDWQPRFPEECVWITCTQGHMTGLLHTCDVSQNFRGETPMPDVMVESSPDLVAVPATAYPRCELVSWENGAADIQARPGYVKEILHEGGKRARRIAQETIAEVYDKMGLA